MNEYDNTILFKNNTYKYLNFSYMEDSCRIHELSIYLLNNNTLKKLALEGYNICDNELIFITAALISNKTLKKLYLSCRNLTDLSFIFLSKMLDINKIITYILFDESEYIDRNLMNEIIRKLENNRQFETRLVYLSIYLPNL